MMSHHRQPCRHVDYNAKSNDVSDVGDVAEMVKPLCIAAIRQREVLCVLRMQEKEWMFLDDIKYDNIEDVKDVPVVKDPVVGSPFFDPTT